MQFHWYWPFAREEELDWTLATARAGETIVVQTIDRVQAPTAGSRGAVTVVRDLPDVDRNARGMRWLASRANTYHGRSVARRKMWRRETFDLVHLHYLNRFTDSILSMPSPLVLSVHDVIPHVLRLGPLERTILQRAYNAADGLVVHHTVLASQLMSEFGVGAHKVHVVPHQVFGSPDSGSPPSDSPPTLLFFGALRRNKGLSVLLDAFDRLADADIRLVIAGRGDRSLEALARKAAAADPRISAEVGLVSLERKRELFAEASIAVLPYTSFASQSGVLHDAYSHERPVVVTDVGALGDTVLAEGTGLVAEASDPASLADKIAAALEPDMWARLAEGCAVIRRERSPQRIGTQLREVYDVVMRGR